MAPRRGPRAARGRSRPGFRVGCSGANARRLCDYVCASGHARSRRDPARVAPLTDAAIAGAYSCWRSARPVLQRGRRRSVADDSPGALARVQGFPRSARRWRGLDTRGALPPTGNYRSAARFNVCPLLGWPLAIAVAPNSSSSQRSIGVISKARSFSSTATDPRARARCRSRRTKRVALRLDPGPFQS
jgi:hypothetical protein